MNNRKDKINELYDLLKDVQRGKTNRQLQSMQDELGAGISKQKLLEIIHVSASYNAKLTDDRVGS